MNGKRQGRWLLVGLAASGAALAQPTNPPAKADYAFFKTIPDRNIFNPNRYPHRAGTRRPETVSTASVDAFALVGTMSYPKGTFAFFDGSKPDYQKVLERGGSIAGFKLLEIQPDRVRLLAGGKAIELKVGDHLRHDEETGWQVVLEADTPPAAGVEAAATAGPASDVGGDQNEILKKLMQQREQELK